MTESLLPLAVSLALGFLIGLERGWHNREAEEGTRVAGVRTYALIGLFGGITGLLTVQLGWAVIGFAFLALTGVLITGYTVATRQKNDIGITSLIAALMTFVLGIAATQNYMVEAVVTGGVTALLLGYKATLHRWVKALSDEELHDILKLFAVSIVMLSILPDKGYGPWEALNPFQIWWMVVLIAGISFFGYFTIKIIGEKKGALLTALIAGFVSSTALTLHFSRLARKARTPATKRTFATGILLACGMMFPRILVVASLINGQVFQALVFPVTVMGIITFVSAGVLWQRTDNASAGDSTAKLENPLELKSALVFGGLLALITLAAKGLQLTYGDTGLIALAGLSGIADVDAVTLTLSQLSRTETTVDTAALCIILASISNSLVKGGLTLVIAGPKTGRYVLIPLILAVVAGMVMVWV